MGIHLVFSFTALLLFSNCFMHINLTILPQISGNYLVIQYNSLFQNHLLNAYHVPAKYCSQEVTKMLFLPSMSFLSGGDNQKMTRVQGAKSSDTGDPRGLSDRERWSWARRMRSQ